MHIQAEEKESPASGEKPAALTLAVSSGKGGVGKTNLTTNLGIALAQNGHKVCIFDADTSLANINILLGLKPEFTLEALLDGEKDIEDILLTGPAGLRIVPSANGIAEYAQLSDAQQSRILSALQKLESSFDYLLIDTAAGIGENVIRFLQSAHFAVIIVTPEPTALTDAFSLVKVLHRRHYRQPIYTLVNMADNYQHSAVVFKRFSHAINKYIHLKVHYLGYVPQDNRLRNAVATQTPIMVSAPQSPAGRCLSLLAQILQKHFEPQQTPQGSISAFWRRQHDPELAKTIRTETVDQPLTVEPDTDVLTNRRENETARILALATDALMNREFSQLQMQSLLMDLLKSYLQQFDSLPETVADLIQQHETTKPQAARPEEPPDSTTAIDSYVETGSTRPPEKAQQALTQQIDALVDTAQLNKQQLISIADSLNRAYRTLYNRKPPAARTILGKAATDRRDGLYQSIRFASATDTH